MSNDSRVAQTVRQRGIAIAAGGFLVQLFAMVTFIGGGSGTIAVLALLAAAAVSGISFASVTDRTGLSNFLTVVSVIASIVSAVMGDGGFGAILFVLIGAVVSFFGNGQLVKGIKG